MKVFIISDTHFPFHHKVAYRKMLEHVKKEKPDVIIQIGDLLDQYVFSKFPRSHSVSVEQDIMTGLRAAKDMWATLNKMCPKAKKFQVLGNHDRRMTKRIIEKLPELEQVYNPNSLYEFDGVKTLQSDRDYLTLDGVIYCHGWFSKSLDHARHFNSPCVHGHTHRAGIETRGRIWSMDVGFLADESTLPLSYGASKFTTWKLACGVVEDKQPRLIFL